MGWAVYGRRAVKASFLTLKWDDTVGKKYVQPLLSLKWWLKSNYRRQLEFRLQNEKFLCI